MAAVTSEKSESSRAEPPPSRPVSSLGRPGFAVVGALLTLAALAAALLQPPYREARELSLAREPLAWFLNPIEYNAFARLPAIDGPLHAVALSADGERAVAVAPDGNALVSDDGGVSWSLRPTGGAASPPANQIGDVALSADGLRGVAVGEGGIRATADGGATWTTPSGGFGTLRGVALSRDGRRAAAVGDNGAILISENGGANWIERRVPSLLSGIALSADGQRGVAVGNLIMRTANGGRTWVTVPSQFLAVAVDLSADGRRGVAAGPDGIATTEDGGATWTPRATTLGAPFEDVDVSDDGLTGVAVALSGEVWTTANGGSSWTRRLRNLWRSSVTGAAISADGRQILLVGPEGVIFASPDGGVTWYPRSRHAAGHGRAIALSADGRRGFALALNGLVYTGDGGRSWTTLAEPERTPLRDIAISADGERGILSTDNGILLTMEDGGARWAAGRMRVSVPLSAIALSADGMRGVGDQTGTAGIIGSTLITTDGGANWRSGGGLPDPSNGLALSSDGMRGVAWIPGRAPRVTRTGGVIWSSSRFGPIDVAIGDLAVSGDGLRSLAVGESGTILRSEDGGISWSHRVHRSRAHLFGVALSRDGTRGVAVGPEGAILSSADGGVNWHRRQSGTDGALSAVSLSADGRRGIALGRGEILTTQDGGASWRRVSQRRYPAPWLYPTLALTLWLTAVGLRPVRATATGIAGIGVTDNPVAHPDEDRLGRAALAADVSAFLRNRETKPPLTIAIIGDWGSGKSSIMRMLCHDMRRFGARPVWFNAWHHEQEEHLLAALWSAIRAQAPPSWWTLDGIAFRARLLWRRTGRNLPVAILLLFVAAMVVGSLQAYGLDPWRTFLAELFSADWGEALGALPGPLAQLGALGAIGLALSRALRAFGTSPGMLAQAAIGKMNLREANLAIGARSSFEREFGEVSAALPQPMLIVIDDLDRCRPETVATVLESINFLVTCGQCYVVLGIARTIVLRAIGLSFKDIAAETATTAGQSEGDNALKLRRDYAESYLEKLINIEIDVPPLSAGDARRLLAGEAEERAPETRRATAFALRTMRRAAAGLALLGIVLVGLWLGPMIEPPVRDPAPRIDAAATATATLSRRAPTPRPEGAAAVRRVGEPPDAPSAAPDPRLTLEPGAGGRQHWLVIGILLIAAVLTAAGMLLFHLRQMAREVQDSPAFASALDRWGPALETKLRTPRAVRRFGNRMRLLAMRQRPPEARRSFAEEMRLAARFWWRKLIRRADAGEALDPVASDGPLDEATLVALGTLSSFYPGTWRTVATSSPDTLDKALQKAVERQSWPVAPTQIAAFGALTTGVRVHSEP